MLRRRLPPDQRRTLPGDQRCALILLDLRPEQAVRALQSIVAAVLHKEPTTWLHPQAPADGANSRHSDRLVS
jgi:hypothetical protein